MTVIIEKKQHENAVPILATDARRLPKLLAALGSNERRLAETVDPETAPPAEPATAREPSKRPARQPGQGAPLQRRNACRAALSPLAPPICGDFRSGAVSGDIRLGR